MNKQTQQKAAREIAAECGDLYEEICDLQKKLGWATQKQLCEKIYVAVHNDDENLAGEKAEIEKLRGQIKKMFQRKGWEQNTATSRTLVNLREIRNAIYKTDDYRYSDLYESDLPPEMRKAMEKESKELRKWLKETDYEE